ncbi:DNA/RNA non-specific endonuclease [Leuconostoc palmae]|uniref:DNA/RNA non-specific endonuclease n=1 Tax=Leuconostoc palmae TaxID=501487 RepID=UPI001C7D0C69|nr:DNA/RNA non-specific endonuclease [Leuconostoc palmae]
MARKRSYKNNTNQLQSKIISVLIVLAIVMFYLWQNHRPQNPTTETKVSKSIVANDNQALLNIQWDGTLDGDIVHINNNQANFSDTELKDTFPSQGSKLRPVDGLSLSPLDALGRSQQGNFLASQSSMDKVTTRPQRIGYDVRPSGWFINDHYDGTKWVGGYHNNPNVKLGKSKQPLWNKSHIVGYQFFGLPTMVTENMTTGTRVENAYPGQLAAEDDIRNAIKKNPTVKIRGQVTPLYLNSERIPRGVHYMAKSVDDNGKTLNFNYWIFNVQPGITIDYATGKVTVNEK